MIKFIKYIFIFLIPVTMAFSSYSCKIAVLKYNGGGDWYANPSSLNNLIEFCQTNLNININPIYDVVDVASSELFRYPFIHMTGHGNVVFSITESENLRKYLMAGGFLHIDDNYGMDPFIRPEMKKVFHELDFFELPFSILFIIKAMFLKMVYLKFMNTTINLLEVMV